jgi:hypothetical protein
MLWTILVILVVVALAIFIFSRIGPLSKLNARPCRRSGTRGDSHVCDRVNDQIRGSAAHSVAMVSGTAIRRFDSTRQSAGCSSMAASDSPEVQEHWPQRQLTVAKSGRLSWVRVRTTVDTRA